MKIKVVVIEVELPAWVRKTFSLVAPAAAVLVSGIVLAAPHQWNTGDPLTAGDLNKLSVVTVGATSISVGATHYCGTGPSPVTGNLSFNGKLGYQAAKAMCEAASGCGSTAHMCDSAEVIRSAQLGDPLPSTGWFSAAVFAAGPTSGNESDCRGWSSNNSSDGGPIIQNASGAPGLRTCDVATPVLCCE